MFLLVNVGSAIQVALVVVQGVLLSLDVRGGVPPLATLANMYAIFLHH